MAIFSKVGLTGHLNFHTFNISLACQVANRPNMRRRALAENGFQACGLEASKSLR